MKGFGFRFRYRDGSKLPQAVVEHSLCELAGVPLGVEGEDQCLVVLGDVEVAIDRATPFYLRQSILPEFCSSKHTCLCFLKISIFKFQIIF